MATAWNLDDGMNVDYSGERELAASRKRFRESQDIIDRAYSIDREAETQQSNIDALNLKNEEFVADVQAKRELEAQLAEQSKAFEVEQQASRVQDGFEPVLDNAGIPIPTNELTDEQLQARTPRFIDTPATKEVRQKSRLEVLQAALPTLKSPRAQLAARDAIKKEVFGQAAQLHLYQPDLALKMLADNGYGVSVNLSRNADQTFNMRLPDGRTRILSALDATAMVGDVMAGTNKLQEGIRARQEAVRKESLDLAKEKRKEAADEAKDLRKDAADEAKDLRKDKRETARDERKYEFQFKQEQMRLTGRLGAGRFGRQVVGFEEDENGDKTIPIYGGGFATGGTTGRASSAGGKGGDDRIVDNTAPRAITPINLTNKSVEELQNGQSKLNATLTTMAKQPGGQASADFVRVQKQAQAVATELGKRKKTQKPTGGATGQF